MRYKPPKIIGIILIMEKNPKNAREKETVE